MNLNESFDVRPEKLAALKERIVRLGLRTELIEETFARGGGKGGQKVNKTSNAVHLKYPPLGLAVRCHRERRRTLNRFLALRELVDQAEMVLSPGTSARLAEFDRLRRRKADRARRNRVKPASRP